MIHNQCNIEADIDAEYSSYPSAPYWNDTNAQSIQNKWINSINFVCLCICNIATASAAVNLNTGLATFNPPAGQMRLQHNERTVQTVQKYIIIFICHGVEMQKRLSANFKNIMFKSNGTV